MPVMGGVNPMRISSAAIATPLADHCQDHGVQESDKKNAASIHHPILLSNL